MKFAYFPEIKEDIVAGDQRNKIYQSLTNYLEIVREVLLKDELFKNYSNDEMNEILEDIESFIIRKSYKRIFPNNELSEDREFFNKTNNLSWLTPQHSEIKPIYINEKLWAIAIASINKMDEEKSPIEKLKCRSNYITFRCTECVSNIE